MGKKEQYEDYLEDESDEDQDAYISSSLDFDKWFIDPLISRSYADINKDQSGGNLDKYEKQAISTIDRVIGILEALKDDGQLDKEIIDIFIRKKHSILITSLSKDGFLRELSKTTKQFQKMDIKGYPMGRDGYKPGFLNTRSKQQRGY